LHFRVTVADAAQFLDSIKIDNRASGDADES
jgi:hypothetical protein